MYKIQKNYLMLLLFLTIFLSSDIVKGAQMLKQERDQLRQARQTNQLVDVESVAASSRPQQQPRNQYVRPEDVIIQPEQLFPSYGVGTNVLAQDGAVIRDNIGGNPTEIQNTYAPNTIYTDLGYEPLNDSNQLKHFAAGGKLQVAQGGGNFGQFMNQYGPDITNISTQMMGGPNAGSDIGEAIGSAAQAIIPIPGLRQVGRIVGTALDKNQKEILLSRQLLVLLVFWF